MFGFEDTETIKQRVRANMLKPEAYSVFDFYWETGLFQEIAKHHVFENVTLAVISANAIWIAVDTDHNHSDNFLDSHAFFQTGEHLFCFYFSLEWFVRFMSFKRKSNGLKDAWFVFDSLLVFMMVCETWVLTAITVASGSSGASPLGNTAILRLFRLLRLSRLMRMLRSLPELMILVKGMITAMKSVMYVMCLLVIVTYVFAIAVTQLSEGTEMKETYFQHVSLSMYSLLIYGTFLDDLSAFCDDIRAEKPIVLVVVFLFICLGCLTVMNMLIGVLCEVISQVAATEKEEMLCTLVKDKLGGIVKSLDTDINGRVSYNEFKQILANPDALSALEQVGVDPIGIVDFADLFFLEDGKPIELTFEQFMEMVLDLRGSNGATVKDIMNLWKQTNTKLMENKMAVQALQDSTQRIEAESRVNTARLEKKIDLVLSELQKLNGRP